MFLEVESWHLEAFLGWNLSLLVHVTSSSDLERLVRDQTYSVPKILNQQNRSTEENLPEFLLIH